MNHRDTETQRVFESEQNLRAEAQPDLNRPFSDPPFRFSLCLRVSVVDFAS